MKKEEIVKAIIKNLRDVNGKKFRKDDVQAIVNFFIMPGSTPIASASFSCDSLRFFIAIFKRLLNSYIIFLILWDNSHLNAH